MRELRRVYRIYPFEQRSKSYGPLSGPACHRIRSGFIRGHVYAFEVAGVVMITAIVDREPVDEVESYRQSLEVLTGWFRPTRHHI